MNWLNRNHTARRWPGAKQVILTRSGNAEIPAHRDSCPTTHSVGQNRIRSTRVRTPIRNSGRKYGVSAFSSSLYEYASGIRAKMQSGHILPDLGALVKTDQPIETSHGYFQPALLSAEGEVVVSYPSRFAVSFIETFCPIELFAVNVDLTRQCGRRTVTKQ